MLKRLILLFVLFLPVAIGEDLSPYTYVISNVNVDGEINLDYQDSSSNLDYFDATVYFIPIEYLGQEVNSLDITYDPSAIVQQENDKLNIRWNQDSIRLKYEINSEVKSKNIFRNIDKKIPFPTNNFNEDQSRFLGEKEFTDIDRDIRAKANEIVAGEDDYYEAVFKIAEWTRVNIKYDLNTLTEKSVQKSSWVLSNRYGVCDELTNLFTSMVRSLGIPVKYVSGLAYSDVVGGWSPHAWNEVYFPNVGWVPFDVTFGQYGWIDPGHIKMIEGEDAHEPSVEYFWRAIKIGINDKSFNVNASLIENGEKFSSLTELKIDLLNNNVGAGSYVPIEVIVRNLQPFYLSSLIYVTAAPGLVGDNSQGILLKPYQEKRIYWLLNITEELDLGLKYEGEIEIRDSFGSIADAGIVFGKGFEVISFEKANETLNGLIEKEENVKDYDLDLNCDTDKDNYFKYENIKVNCNLKNNGNVPLNFNLCLKNDCKEISLGILDKQEETFSYSLKEYKNEKLSATVKNDNLDVESVLIFRVYDKPVVNIDEIKYNDVDYDEKSEIEINLEIIPYVNSLEVSSSLGSISLNEPGGKQKIIVPFNGWDLNEGENIVSFTVKYKNNGNENVINEDVKININKVNEFRKLLVLFKRIFQ